VTVRSRLLLTIGGIILLLLVPATYGVTQLQQLRDLADRLADVHAEDILNLGQYRAALAELDRLQHSFVATPDETSFRDAIRSELNLARQNLILLHRSGYQDAVEPSLTYVRALDDAQNRLEALVDQGDLQAATAYFEGVKPLLDSARLSTQPVVRALEERGRRSASEARDLSAAAARTTMLAVAVALLLTLVLGLWTADALSRPIRRLSSATQTVADGQFEAPRDLPYDRGDEIGDLSRAFGTMTERLAELDRLKAEFVSLASHELKTPINVIAGYAELLDEGLYGEMDQKQLKVIGLIQGQTKTLTRLVNQLLDLSRFEAGGLRVEPGPTNLDRLLSEVEESFRALATQKQIEFDVSAAETLPSPVVVDHDRIRHEVLGNLLSNAFKFTAPGGEIAVKAWAEDGTLHLRVSDSGVGIPQDQLEHVFEKYYQVGDEAKAKGSGLGLAIAKHVVEAHGGRITASSTLGEGTSFSVLLPADGPPE
jgi:signal transduction histidine kinase